MPFFEEYYHPQIDPEKEEICEDCNGEGRVTGKCTMTHREYWPCMTCEGHGKTIKRDKCKVCDKKERIDRDWHNKGKWVTFPEKLCIEHYNELIHTRESIEQNKKRAKDAIASSERIAKEIADLIYREQELTAQDKKESNII